MYQLRLNYFAVFDSVAENSQLGEVGLVSHTYMVDYVDGTAVEWPREVLRWFLQRRECIRTLRGPRV